jgi:hypothetical protein
MTHHDRLVSKSAANISEALLGIDSAMDDIPLFSPAARGLQAWLAYHKLSTAPALTKGC